MSRRAVVRVALGPLLCLIVLATMPALTVPAGAQSETDKWSVDRLVDTATGRTTTTTPKPPPAPTTTRPAKPSGTTTAPPKPTTTVAGQAPSPSPSGQPPSAPVAGAGAPAPNGPPPPPPPLLPGAAPAAPGPSAPGSPGASAGASGFGDGQLLRLLQESAARRRHLDVRLAELEATLTRLEAEMGVAQAALYEAQSDQQEVTARVEATAYALAQTRSRVRRALLGDTGQPRSVQMPSLRPVGINVQPGLLSLPSLQPSSGARARPADPLAAGRQPDARLLRELLSWHRELTAQGQRQAQELVGAQQRTAVATNAVLAAQGPLDAERASLAALRRDLSAALSDPTVMLQGRSLSANGAEMARPSQLALTDIPADYLALYQQAATTCPGLSWTVVAAIGSIESSHGRLAAPGVRDGANFAGAMGPMQFLAPTWAAYGVDGDKDGKRDVYNAGDAVFGAANYLCASGGGDPARLPDAIWAYNHADWYVDRVLVLALRYGAGGLEMLEASAADVARLLSNPNLTLSPQARGDLANGLADQRIVNFLAAAVANHKIAVSVIKSGHSEFVAGTNRVSNHFHGRGIDITAVDGVAVSPSNDSALDLALAVLTASPSLRPDEFGSPWPGLSEFPGAFSDAAHQNHLHLGWR